MHSGRGTSFVAIFTSVFSIIASLACAEAHAASASILGNTPEQVHSRFTSVVEFNLQRDPAAVNRLTGQELADLAYLYGNANGGNFDDLSKIFARKLSPAVLVRLAPYIGVENMQ